MPPLPRQSSMSSHESSPHWRLYAADLSGITSSVLDDSTWLKLCIRRSLATVGSTVHRWTRHDFEPQGVSLIALGPAARVAMHTWPELGKATIDVWTSDPNVEVAVELIAQAVGATHHRRSTGDHAAMPGN